MALSGCLTCIKYTLFVFNFLFWLVGCLLLAVGVWTIVDPSSLRGLANGRDWEISIIIYAMITIGSIVTITGFLGCCGAIRESRCLIILFFILLFVINAIFVSVGLFMVIKREKVTDWFPGPEKEKISKELNDKIMSFGQDDTARSYMKDVQEKYECCGADKGISDYHEMKEGHFKYCRKRLWKTPCTDSIFSRKEEKHDGMMKVLPKYVIIVSAIILGISFLMIVGLILSIILCCALKNELTDTY